MREWRTMDRSILRYSRKANDTASKLAADISSLLREKGFREKCPPLFFAPLKEKHLGLFSSESMCIFLSEELLLCSYDEILQIALHECAHFLTFVKYGSLSHDEDFRKMCALLGAQEEYSRAHVSLRTRGDVLEKVRKLKALSSSPFEAESQSALRKVRQLMASYAIDEDDKEEECIYCTDLFTSASRMSYSCQIIARLAAMQTGAFIVQVRSGSSTSLRAYGSKAELEVTSYLADVLEGAVRKELMKRRRKDPSLYYGVTGSNSFYLGMYEALKSRFESSSRSEESAEKALVLRRDENERLVRDFVFSGTPLVKRKTSHRYSRSARDGGRDFGSQLRINPALGKASAEKLKLT